jgi:hypothetical protein
MLFILVMDTLSRLFGKASEQGLLQPIGHPAIKFQCSLYADDVILFASPTVLEARVIARIMTIFGDASDLKTNLSKCSITPIHGADELLDELHEVLHCQISQFPITYLVFLYLPAQSRGPTSGRSLTRWPRSCRGGRGR